MIARRLIVARRKVAEEDGVIALATLAFLISAGMAVIILLWSIGVITGAFNNLYAANQAAAYAAASATTLPDPTDPDSTAQLAFQCNYSGADSTLCIGGKSLDAAQAVMSTMLNRNRPGDFGLQYGDNASLYDPGTCDPEVTSCPPSLRAYSIGLSPGSAKAQADVYGCNFSSATDPDAGFTAIGGDQNQNKVDCWRLNEFGIQFPIQYTSAVVTHSYAKVTVIPGCTLALCSETIYVVAAASQDQPNPYTCYSEYYGTTCSKRQPTTPPPPVTKPTIIPRPAGGCPSGYRPFGSRWCKLRGTVVGVPVG